MPDDLNAPEETEQDRNWKQLRQEREAAETAAAQAKAEAEAATRELAFLKAGLDPTDPKTSYFAKGYDGEMTVDAIKTAATDAGFLTPPEPEVPAEDAEALARIASQTPGGNVPVNPGVEDELRAAAAEQAAKGSLMTPEQIAAFLESKGEPVVYEGPHQSTRQPVPWDSPVLRG